VVVVPPVVVEGGLGAERIERRTEREGEKV
jgi:hypothetical protein